MNKKVSKAMKARMRVKKLGKGYLPENFHLVNRNPKRARL